MSSVQASAVVFCDADNGLTFDEPCRSLRHIGVDEIRSLYSRGQSLVVYHTPDRSAPHAEQIASFLERLRQAIPDLGSSWAARFRRGSSRVFFVLAQRAHGAAIDGAMVQMRSTAWVHGGHFEIVPGDAKGRSPRSTPGAALVSGQEHGDPLGDVCADQVAGGGAPAIVEEAGRHPGRLAGGAPRRAPAADRDPIAVEDKRAGGVAACPPAVQRVGVPLVRLGIV